MSAQRLLVVEDDLGLRDVLARGLRSEGFDVVTASDGESALRSASHDVGAVVLDIGLPDSDGRDVCQALRTRGIDAPVIFLTARRDVADRLSGFASGGDDYLLKPFAFPELVARLRALLRRSTLARGAQPGGLRVDPVTHALRCDEHSVVLSPTEYRLLARLLAVPEGVVRRRQLLAAAWPSDAVVSDNTLDQYVSKVRRKLAEVGSERTIQTMRGVGYRLI